MSYAIQVKSEIGRLRKVLLHRPGEELSRIIPGNMEDLLFEDTPHLATAQKEHDAFAEVLKDNGVQILYIKELAAEALKSCPTAKKSFVSELVSQSGVFVGRYKDYLMDYYMELDEAAIVKKAIEGLTLSEFGFGPFGAGLSRLKAPDSQFIARPMPNMYFARDPMASIGNGIAISHMRYPVRNRETIFTKYIFENHPDFAGKTKFYYKKHWPFCVEGGDILNLSDKVLGIGISQRTTPAGIEFLARSIFSDPSASIDTILAFDIPKQRSCIHLDTIFTQVDVNKFLIYAGIMASLRPPFVLEKQGDDGQFTVKTEAMPLDSLLSKYLNLNEVELIYCGADNSINAAREQWNNAANTLAVAPGVVICYDRNDATNHLLEEKGIKVLQIPSSEVSRGRGGPRCMSMPIFRDL